MAGEDHDETSAATENHAATENQGEDVSGLKSALSKERDARRRAEQDAKAKTDELKKVKDADKSEMDKIKERLDESEKRAQKAEAQNLRNEVASTKGLSPAQAKRLVGSSKEELESDADELLATFGVKTTGGSGDSGRGSEESGHERDESSSDGSGDYDSRRVPKEKLRSGASNKEEPSQTPEQLADAVQKRARGF